MGRRIRILGVVLVLAFGLIIVQLVNIQYAKAHQLATSTNNPRVAVQRYENPRGTIYAADGTTVLAQSIPTPAGTSPKEYAYKYVRQYPQGPLYAGITGYDSALYYGTTGIEEQYNSYLSAHEEPETFSDVLSGSKAPMTTDSVTLTVQPELQQFVSNELNSIPPGANKDGAVVVLDPSTGAVEAMVSNPTFDPNVLVSTSLSAEQLGYVSYNTPDHEDFEPLQPIATGYPEAPGSTFKVVTSTAAYNLKPSLDNFDFPVAMCVSFYDSGGHALCDQSGPCGGTMTAMLPASCDPGYGKLGVEEGIPTLQKQAELFGYDSVPPIDLPNVAESVFSTLQPNAQAFLAQSAIGQYDDRVTALQNAMVASGIANGGVVMTPHLMSEIHDTQGNLVEKYTPKPMPRAASASAAAAVVKLMRLVTMPGGTAGPSAGFSGFPSYLCAAVKTGTAQTGSAEGVNTDWMIGFAPANNPQVAVAVVVPKQDINSDGADVAGPIMRAVLEHVLPVGSVTNCGYTGG
jgi:peptidoglycan glycosyltransferase